MLPLQPPAVEANGSAITKTARSAICCMQDPNYRKELHTPHRVLRQQVEGASRSQARFRVPVGGGVHELYIG